MRDGWVNEAPHVKGMTSPRNSPTYLSSLCVRTLETNCSSVVISVGEIPKGVHYHTWWNSQTPSFCQYKFPAEPSLSDAASSSLEWVVTKTTTFCTPILQRISKRIAVCR